MSRQGGTAGADEEVEDDVPTKITIQSELKQLDQEYENLEKEEATLTAALKQIQKEAACFERAIAHPSKNQRVGTGARRAAVATSQQEMAAMQNLANALMGDSDDDNDDENSNDTGS